MKNLDEKEFDRYNQQGINQGRMDIKREIAYKEHSYMTALRG